MLRKFTPGRLLDRVVLGSCCRRAPSFCGIPPLLPMLLITCHESLPRSGLSINALNQDLLFLILL